MDVDVNFKDINGRTPLSKAAANGHMGVVDIFLARQLEDVDVDEMDLGPDPHGSAPSYYPNSKRRRIF